MVVSRHAQQRMSERDITFLEIRYAVACSRPQRRRQYRIFRIGPRELRRLNPRLHRRLAGLCVVCTARGLVVTTYRRTAR